jgi:hypothetical protein
VSLAFPHLAATRPREDVAYVLAEEVRRGRVRHENGGYRLVEAHFPADVLAALRGFVPPDPDESRPVRRTRLGARPSGDLARSFA